MLGKTLLYSGLMIATACGGGLKQASFSKIGNKDGDVRLKLDSLPECDPEIEQRILQLMATFLNKANAIVNDQRVTKGSFEGHNLCQVEGWAVSCTADEKRCILSNSGDIFEPAIVMGRFGFVLGSKGPYGRGLIRDELSLGSFGGTTAVLEAVDKRPPVVCKVNDRGALAAKITVAFGLVWDYVKAKCSL